MCCDVVWCDVGLFKFRRCGLC
ncbi:hypothetical protein M3J09_002802 [Ascochyta lentis]